MDDADFPFLGMALGQNVGGLWYPNPSPLLLTPNPLLLTLALTPDPEPRTHNP